jgi:hypothetical protein
MSDNATDRLRELLDERGVEYDLYGGDVIKKTCWESNGIAYEYTEVTAQGGTYCEFRAPRREGVTPEQAIAATVGAGTCYVKAVKKLGDLFGIELSCGHSMVNPFNDHPDYCPWCGRKVVGA